MKAISRKMLRAMALLMLTVMLLGSLGTQAYAAPIMKDTEESAPADESDQITLTVVEKQAVPKAQLTRATTHAVNILPIILVAAILAFVVWTLVDTKNHKERLKTLESLRMHNA